MLAYTLFYLDPPYYGCEGDYGKELFNRSEFTNIAGIMSNSKGKCIMSINDVEPIREIYRDFRLVEMKTSYSVNKGELKHVGELLIMNF